MEEMNSVNQVNYSSLKESNVAAVITALFVDPAVMSEGDNIFSWWNTPYEAAKYELYRHNKYYDDLIKKSEWSIVQILNWEDLRDSINNGNLWIIKHIEGFYFLDSSDVKNIIDNVHNMWVRSVGLTRNVNNNLAEWSNDKWKDYGLTNLWREFIDYMWEKRMILDLAHLSRKSVGDVLDHVDYPVMASHSSLTSNLNNHRLLTEEHAKKIADLWWVVWLVTMKNYDNKYNLTNIIEYVQQLKYLVKMLWEDHVCIWSDFDWLEKDHIVDWLDSVDSLPFLIQEMKSQWMWPKLIEKILHKNAKNFIISVL